jgi:hypothetical protein
LDGIARINVANRSSTVNIISFQDNTTTEYFPSATVLTLYGASAPRTTNELIITNNVASMATIPFDWNIIGGGSTVCIRDVIWSGSLSIVDSTIWVDRTLTIAYVSHDILCFLSHLLTWIIIGVENSADGQFDCSQTSYLEITGALLSDGDGLITIYCQAQLASSARLLGHVRLLSDTTFTVYDAASVFMFHFTTFRY